MIAPLAHQQAVEFIHGLARKKITPEVAFEQCHKHCFKCARNGLTCGGESCKGCPCNTFEDFRKEFLKGFQNTIKLRHAPSWWTNATKKIRGPKAHLATTIAHMDDEWKMTWLNLHFNLVGKTADECINIAIERGEEEYLIYKFYTECDEFLTEYQKVRLGKISSLFVSDAADEIEQFYDIVVVEDCSDNGPRPDRKVRRQGIIRKRRGW